MLWAARRRIPQAAAGLLAVGLGALALGSSAALAGHDPSLASRCDPPYPFDPPHFSKKVRRINHTWSNSHKPIPRGDAREIVKVVWKKLYKRCHHRSLTKHQVQYRIDGNLRQIGDDSGFIPAARSPTGQHAKGLVQLIDPVFASWQVPGFNHVYHPLDDVLAAVNIQLNAHDVISVYDGHHYAHNVLDGRHHGWGFHGGDNPYKPFR